MTIDADNGEIVAGHIFGEVRVTSRGGNVRLTELNGPVDIRADGEEVYVSWTSFPAAKDSSITNDSGGVSVEFSTSGGCLVQAQTKEGRIETVGLPRVVVSDDRSQAQGSVGRMSRPLLKIVANGDVRLTGNGPAEAETQ